LVFLDVLLGDHVLNGSCDLLGLHSVDFAEGEAEQAIAGTLSELWREAAGEFYSLVLDSQSSEAYIVSADVARSGRAVTILDLPGAAGTLFVGRGFLRVENIVVANCGFSFNVKVRRPYIEYWSTSRS
jgi:hypothetical protein